jgi:hypothetical protein
MAVLVWVILLAALGIGVFARRLESRRWDRIDLEAIDKDRGHRPAPSKYL